METHLLTLWLLLFTVSGGAIKFNAFKSSLRPQEGDVRLSGLKGPSEGRVEVYHSGQWGTVCDDNWDMTEAEVVCRQLNFPGASSVLIGGKYEKAPEPIWLDEINCNGTEKHLTACHFNSWGQTDCSHKEDVGVVCKTGTNSTSDNATHSFDHSISLSDDLGHLFESGSGCDFVIVAQSPTGNVPENGTSGTTETEICAHKVILSQYPLFRASEGVANITVDVSSTCQPFFTPFIRYIYTRKIDVKFSSAICLRWMASTFGVTQLKEEVGRLFSTILPEDASFHTQLSLYNYALETEDLLLLENCVRSLAWNYQNLAASPAWASLPVELLGALLASSDLVVPDEYFVLQSAEGWITEKKSAISPDKQAELLGHIRFPMIPVEKLYELESSSPLYSFHNTMYRDKVMKAFEFNVLLFSNLVTKPTFNKAEADYQPRSYTAAPWTTVVRPSSPSSSSRHAPSRSAELIDYYSRRGIRYQHVSRHTPVLSFTSFSTPVHSSLIFKNDKVDWTADVFTSKSECSRQGLSCDSLPVAWLVPRNQGTIRSNVLYRNRVVVTCDGKYVCQVQSFKGNQASGDRSACSCPEEKRTYQFVVRPEYV